MEKQVIEETIRAILVDQLCVDEKQITREANLVDDLGADSLDGIETVMDLEERFNIKISDDDANGVKTVGDYIDMVARLKG